MKKIYEKQSIWSKLLNFSFCLTKSKKISSDVTKTKNFIDKYSQKKMNEQVYAKYFKKEKIKDITVFVYNGSLTKTKEKVLIYIHGGSFIEHANRFQIEFARLIAKKTNSTLIVPIYELLPSGSCEKLINLLDVLYEEILTLKPEKINFLGDSAGGGTVLAYSMILRDKNVRNADNIIMLSPWVDLGMTNPLLIEDEKKDTMNGLEGTKYAGSLWARNMEITDPKVSPIHGDFSNLGKLTLIFGGKELLTSECIRFHNLLNKEKVEHNFIMYKNEGHDFAAFPTKEGKKAIEDIAVIINN